MKKSVINLTLVIGIALIIYEIYIHLHFGGILMLQHFGFFASITYFGYIGVVLCLTSLAMKLSKKLN